MMSIVKKIDSMIREETYHRIANQFGTGVGIAEWEGDFYPRYTNVSKIPLKDLASNTHSLRQAIKEQKESDKGRIFIKEFPPSTITPNHLKAFVKKLTDTGVPIHAIVLDYLNLLHSTVGTNSYERIKNVTEQVRAMSYIFNCPIISATQLNRSGFNTDNPDLATISESVGLAATADVIVSIFQNEEDRDLGIIRLGMMKNRYGPRGHTQPMRIDYSTLTITKLQEILLAVKMKRSIRYNYYQVDKVPLVYK